MNKLTNLLLSSCMVAAFCSTAALAEEKKDMKEFSYTVRDLSFKRDGKTINGKLYLPDTDKFATVIISHGFGSSYRSTANDAERFAKAGIASYIFDFCGGSPDSTSDGKMTEMSVLTEKSDLNAVIDGIKKSGLIDNDNLFLMGESQGGFVSAMVARDREAEINGLIMFYPALVIPDDARKRYSSISEVPDESVIFEWKVGKIYYSDTLDMDAYSEIKGFKKDVLIIHGDADNIVPLSYSQRAQKEYKSAELEVVKGAGHGFRGAQLDDACAKTVEFIRAHIK